MQNNPQTEFLGRSDAASFAQDSYCLAAKAAQSPLPLFRREVETMQQNGITSVAFSRFDDPRVIPLWFGEGDVVTPDFIREEAKSALDDGNTFYVHTQGLPEMRQAIKAYLDGLYGTDIALHRITVPGSAMLGVTIAAQAALSRGDHGLIVGPAWPNIEAVLRVTGADIGHASLRLAKNGWQLDLEEVFSSVQPNTRAIYINSPSNPTGWLMAQPEQHRLLNFCRERNILLISDEVYHRTVYDADYAPSFLEIASDSDPLIVINGLSKAWAMTGWRLGWMVTPSEPKIPWMALSECFNTGATVFAQHGGIAALERGEGVVRELRDQYRAGRAIVDAALAGHELFDYHSPPGAFYAFPRIRGLTDSFAFALDLLREEDVGVAPGFTFGPGFESHMRLSFAQSHEKLAEGVKRLVGFVERTFG